ncbi:hypothetical protein EDB83DRAFT_2515752 [Lactarius deliciosus]|nr:hypothetical protein EDB83DRAFT_2515752 [Lactarius deliciosus]
MTDIWSNQNRKSFLALTAHWIGEVKGSLTLNSALIAFQGLHGCHTSAALVSLVLDLVDRADITMKTGHFTLDNASNNTSMMSCFQDLLVDHCDVPFDAEDRCVMQLLRDGPSLREEYTNHRRTNASHKRDSNGTSTAMTAMTPAAGATAMQDTSTATIGIHGQL